MPSAQEEEAKARAARILDQLRSPESLRRLEVEKARLQRELFGEVLQSYPAPGEATTASQGILRSTERLYLFISASIPVETLRNYARDVAEIGDPRIAMVLRGFVGGMRHVLPTRRFMLKSMLQKDSSCDPGSRDNCEVYGVNVIIDPLLFRRFEVEQVPTLVYASGVTVEGDASRSEGLPENARFAAEVEISGDAGLAYLLDRLREETKSPSLAGMAATLRRGRE